MGQKVNPIGLRLGINRNWESRWFPAKERAADFIAEDYKIRKFLKKELYYYLPTPLNAGEHTMEYSLSDQAGNQVSGSTTFRVD